jgi:transposase
MDTVVARTLRPWEGKKLKHMKRQKTNAVNAQHARVIRLSRGGVTNRQIAERVGYSPGWVRQLIHRFNDGGIDAIRWYSYYCAPGGPRTFMAHVIEQIVQVALSSPVALIGMSVWSLPKLRAYLIQQKVVAHISLEWLRQILRRRGIRWHRTKSWKESTDPDFASKYRRIRALYAKRPAGGRRLSIDEFGPMNVQPRPGVHLARKGKPDRQRATYSRHHGVRHIFGLYDLERNELVGQFTQKKNRVTFLAFLKWVRRRYRSTEVLHIVLDNVGYHRTAEVLQYAATHRIRFYFTPTNASWLNRIECHFTALKKFVFDNTDYHGHDEQREAIERYFAWRNGKRDISLKAWSSHHSLHKKRA